MATSSNFSTSNQYIKYRITVTENSYDINANKSNITVKVDAWRTNTGYTTSGTGTCYCTIDGTKYSASISASQTITHNSHTVLFSKTLDITHDADGKKNIYVSAYISHQRFSSNSQGFNVALTDIPRQANILTAQDFTDTANPVITYSNPAGSVVDSLQACISLNNSTPTIAYRDIDKQSASYMFELTTSERNALLQATPNSNTLTVYFILKTVINGITYYSSVAKTMTVADAKPVVTGASYQDVNPTTLAITSDATKIIQANSSVQFDVTSIQAVKYATLVSLSVTCNAVTSSKALSGSSTTNESLSFGTVNSAENIDAYLTVTDSRGNQTTITLSLTMLAWALPKATIYLQRKSNYYAETYIKVTSNLSSLGGANTATIQYQYKETTASTYGALQTLTDGVQSTITIDNTKAFDFRIIVSDLLGSTTYNVVLQVGLPILFIDRLLRSVGIGTIPSEQNMLTSDRRIQLKNPLQEKVMDLWSWTSGDGNTRTASMYIYNQDGEILAEVNGRDDSGHVYTRNQAGKLLTQLGYSTGQGGFAGVYDSNGNLRGSLYADNGGHLYLADADGNYIGGIFAGTDGGIIQTLNNDGEIVGILFANQDKHGVFSLRDATGVQTVVLRAGDGSVNAKKCRQSEGVVEVVDTAFNSGNKTFDDDGYTQLTVIAKVTSAGSYNTCSIPVAFLESTNKRFCISDEASYVTFNVKLDNGVYTIAWYSANSSGSIEKVYAHY